MKTEINQSNYEKMKNSMAEVFLQYDQDNMIRKFQLEHDERYLYIRCLERPYRVSRETGQNRGKTAGGALSYSTRPRAAGRGQCAASPPEVED